MVAAIKCVQLKWEMRMHYTLDHVLYRANWWNEEKTIFVYHEKLPSKWLRKELVTSFFFVIRFWTRLHEWVTEKKHTHTHIHKKVVEQKKTEKNCWNERKYIERGGQWKTADTTSQNGKTCLKNKCLKRTFDRMEGRQKVERGKMKQKSAHTKKKSVSWTLSEWQ